MKKILVFLLLITGLVKGQVVVPKSTTTFSNILATGNLTVNGTARVTGASTLSSTNVNGTLSVGSPTAIGTSSLVQMYVTKGTSTVAIGEQASGTGAIWINQATPTTTNYVLNNNTGSTILNGTSNCNLAIGSSTKLNAYGSGVSITGLLGVTGTMSVSSTATLASTLKLGSSAVLTGGNTGTIAVLSDAVFQFTGTGLTAAMGDASTYYFGNAPQTLQTSSVSPFYMPYNATLIGYVANFVVNGGAASAETGTLGINIAGTTTTLSTGITMNAGTGINTFTATGLSVNVNAGQMFCPYITTPTWVTNPGTTTTGITFLFVRRP